MLAFLTGHYLSKPTGFFKYPLAGRESIRSALANDMQRLNQFLNKEESALLDKLSEVVWQKEELDYQHLLLITLKHWLFIHIPLTYVLWILIVLHFVLVFGF